MCFFSLLKPPLYDGGCQNTKQLNTYSDQTAMALQVLFVFQKVSVDIHTKIYYYHECFTSVDSSLSSIP